MEMAILLLDMSHFISFTYNLAKKLKRLLVILTKNQWRLISIFFILCEQLGRTAYIRHETSDKKVNGSSELSS